MRLINERCVEKTAEDGSSFYPDFNPLIHKPFLDYGDDLVLPFWIGKDRGHVDEHHGLEEIHSRHLGLPG